MFKFLTSLSFLYLLAIAVLFIYGWFYYRSFARNRSLSNKFTLAFSLIGIGCFSFLYFNIHAPLSLQTFSNLDHHFIRHDGFKVAGGIELGRTDTVNYRNNNYNSFELTKAADQLRVHSSYSEEPLYVSSGKTFKLLSVNYPAKGHSLGFNANGKRVMIAMVGDTSYILKVNDALVSTSSKEISKASSCWNVFKDDMKFISTGWYTDETIVASLKSVYLLRDEVSGESGGPLVYFVSGKLLQYAAQVYFDNRTINQDNQSFTASVPDKSMLAWGIGFLDNNKNQYRIDFLGKDSFELINRYPVSYPLTEENKNDWTNHTIHKFLVSDPTDLKQMPVIFPEGFLFVPFDGDSSLDFSPVLLSYKKDKGNGDLQLKARFIGPGKGSPLIAGNRLVLPAASASFSWMFSIQDTFTWNYGTLKLAPLQWKLLLFGSLGVFFLLVLATGISRPASKLSWIWQLLSVITLVLLTTRFFLYWRYKSFPPFEGMDLPSLQQLNNFWNLGIIVLASASLGIVFGFGFLRLAYQWIRKTLARVFRLSYHARTDDEITYGNRIADRAGRIPFVRKAGLKVLYFSSWLLVLAACGAVAALDNFNPTTCRHLALVLIGFYFLFIYISYRYSPLVVSVEKSWWGIRTGRSIDIIMNNPVKVLLSASLLALFAFIDIGFAIIFINFLLFNEAFLCINYAIAGLSAGSKRNASLFSLLGIGYLVLFIVNLVYGPYIINFLLELPGFYYIVCIFLFAVLTGYMVSRLMNHSRPARRAISGISSAILLFAFAFLFFPREKILDKAAVTRYRIDVLTMPVDKAIETAYEDGKTYEPVIRAAQNQWFINTFIFEDNNPWVQKTGFHLLPHAPQTKGAKYNAQATDLVASRFLIAEHGKWSVLLYVLLLLVPIVLLASFYKLYPDFTNRINNNYATVTTGFSLLNYLLISALLVILAATGRYIFFGQDLPFGSILSKQSILFPSMIIVLVILLFKRIPLEQYPNRRKAIPGSIVFAGLMLLLFFVKPEFNKEKEFGASDVAKDMDSYIEARLQPLFDYIDTAHATHRLSLSKKDKLFSDTLKQILASGYMEDAGKFFSRELQNYARSDFSRHLDQRKLVYLDLYSGRPRLAVNDNFFHVDPPPHLRELWTGNVYSDSTHWNISLWDGADGSLLTRNISSYTSEPLSEINKDFGLVFCKSYGENIYGQLCLVNRSGKTLEFRNEKEIRSVRPNDSLRLSNPSRFRVLDDTGGERILVVQPDAFMKNYLVNGNRFYVYPMGADFIWARNFAESVSSEYTANNQSHRDAFISLEAVMTDTLSAMIQHMMLGDTAYKKGAEYGICIADGNGRLVAMSDFIKGLERPDPNDKAGFNKIIRGDNGYISQSLLRKEIGNINLLRLNPGPGSTLKPIVFTAIASQLKMDWDAFAAEGFSEKQHFFGGEKVAEYDFEKNNGRISSVADYLRYSDNYYHSNLLLLGSYSKQSLSGLLSKYFATHNPGSVPGSDDVNFHWPYFSYDGKQYWLDGFKNWPGYLDGKANFGSDSSFVSVGLFNNYGIYTERIAKGADRFTSVYDSLLFREAYRRSGFILPEYALFDQKGTGMDNSKPNEVFMSSFRGHVKGSSQVMIPPVKMLDAFGKMISQNRGYALTLNPYAGEPVFNAFDVDNGVSYANYLSIIREKVFEGLKQALYSGTAARLGNLLKNEHKWYYYAKTGTTGDDELKSKSKLFSIIISKKDVTDPGFNFRKNKFYTIYFTSQNGPAKQNEEFQAAVIKYIQESPVFNRYMNSN